VKLAHQLDADGDEQRPLGAQRVLDGVADRIERIGVGQLGPDEEPEEQEEQQQELDAVPPGQWLAGLRLGSGPDAVVAGRR